MQEEEEGHGEVDGLRVANEELQALLDQTLDTAALKVSSLRLIFGSSFNTLIDSGLWEGFRESKRC